MTTWTVYNLMLFHYITPPAFHFDETDYAATLPPQSKMVLATYLPRFNPGSFLYQVPIATLSLGVVLPC
jgi:hypothetical protein